MSHTHTHKTHTVCIYFIHSPDMLKQMRHACSRTDTKPDTKECLDVCSLILVDTEDRHFLLNWHLPPPPTPPPSAHLIHYASLKCDRFLSSSSPKTHMHRHTHTSLLPCCVEKTVTVWETVNLWHGNVTTDKQERLKQTEREVTLLFEAEDIDFLFHQSELTALHCKTHTHTRNSNPYLTSSWGESTTH